MDHWISQLPVWELIRISGIVCFLLLFAGIALGILYSYPGWGKRTKLRLFKLHKVATGSGTLLALAHSILPVISTFMPFDWIEVLVPFAASDHRVLNGIGTIASYLLLLILFTTDIRNKLKRKLWYITHLLSYPMFILVWIHAYFIGADTDMTGIRWMYFMSIIIIVVLTAGRIKLKPGSPASL